jgi:pimeloyl-ACP methyl ester carboxylesterase
VQLADGRDLGYTVAGPPDAPTVMYCHGFPSNSAELRILAPTLTRHAVPARLVAVDRPGFARSSFQPDRSFMAWPRDLAEAADRLGIDRFAVLGVSGGSPYALACAHTLRDRVSRVGILVGVAPRAAPGMGDASVIAGPSANGAVRRLQFELAALAFKKQRSDRFVDHSIASMGPADQAAFARPAFRTWFTELLGGSFAQGGRAAAHEAGLYRRPWGLDLPRVNVDVRLWYGDADATVPAEVGRWLAQQLSSAALTVWSGQGHFTWMLERLAAEAVSWTASPP